MRYADSKEPSQHLQVSTIIIKGMESIAVSVVMLNFLTLRISLIQAQVGQALPALFEMMLSKSMKIEVTA